MKKGFRIIAVLVLALFVLCGLAACGQNIDFTINFIVDSEQYATISTSGNETIAMPENPTKAGYVFDGWYWDKGTWDKPFTANSLLDAPLSENMSVYAKWRASHTHSYSNIWSSNDTHHWHSCICGDKTDKVEHIWNIGEITTPATCETEGVKTFACTVCSATRTESINKIAHSYSNEWSSNNTYHWHECVCGNEADKAEHTFDNGLCLCGYIQETQGLDYSFNTNSQSYTVTGIGTATINNIRIPSEYDDGSNGKHYVTNIGDYAFDGCSPLTSISIPSSVTSIGDFAFSYCAGLTSITIENGVTSIGDWAFDNCHRLTSITLPNSVISIRSYAFNDCIGLKRDLLYARNYR